MEMVLVEGMDMEKVSVEGKEMVSEKVQMVGNNVYQPKVVLSMRVQLVMVRQKSDHHHFDNWSD
jgi:hypothetical protein